MDTVLEEEKINCIKEKLAPFEPSIIYLFGSQAKGEGRLESDIDIAYLSFKRIAKSENFEKAQEIASVLKKEVDLISLADASTVLKTQIIKTGVVLFVKNERDKKEFEMYVLSDYARLNEERKTILERIKKEGTIYG